MDNDFLSDDERNLLMHYVTNVTSPIFALKNLPDVIKGALFSRYSRSGHGLRRLLLKEFIDLSSMGSSAVTDDPILAVQKAHAFYDRILDGYGDDSVGELGGAHMAFEQVSMLAAKVLEDARIGGSPLEKSTRYVHFDQQIDGRYRYYREPALMGSSFGELYEATCDHLFKTYSDLYEKTAELVAASFPHAPEMSEAAYKSALRAKALDLLRGLLPASALTNVGIYGNGRFFESLLQRLQMDELAEMQQIGKSAFIELSKIIPSFVRRGDEQHPHFKMTKQYHEKIKSLLGGVKKGSKLFDGPQVSLLNATDDAYAKLVAYLLFPQSSMQLSELLKRTGLLSEGEMQALFKEIATPRTNRRHKSPRALEVVDFEFEIIADFGAYRDLQRHRMLTQTRQTLSCDWGYTMPEELMGSAIEAPYREAMRLAKEAYDQIATHYPKEAQYIVPMGYHIVWQFKLNLRAAQWLCELRSQPAGHTTYRLIAQQMAQQICTRYPLFTPFFGFVDYGDYSLGRLGQEERQISKGKGALV